MKKISEIRNQKSEIRGFTLIELLIVVGIIGILATLLMVNFIGVRQRARDAQRKTDLRQLQSALELYRADQNSYPNPPLPACKASLCFPAACPVGNTTTVYMKSIPCDPVSSSGYTYSSDGSSYTLTACLENSGDSQKDNPVNGCGSTGVSYTLQNP